MGRAESLPGAEKLWQELFCLFHDYGYSPGEIVRRHGKWVVRIPNWEDAELCAELI